MALSKKALRGVMDSFAYASYSNDSTAHSFINQLARVQCFKREQAMRQFIINARIFYTTTAATHLLMKTDDVDCINVWCDQFINSEITCKIMVK